jgi:hypothetical protein
MMTGNELFAHGYDWTGTRTRRIRLIKSALSAIASIVAWRPRFFCEYTLCWIGSKALTQCGAIEEAAL